MSYLNRLFYIHRELGLAVFLLIASCMELVCSLFVAAPWQYLGWAAAALLAFIAGLLIRSVYRFEKMWRNL